MNELSESDEEILSEEDKRKDFESDGMTVVPEQPNRHDKMES